MASEIVSLLSVCVAIASFIVVVFWASSDAKGYLGAPNWETNLFSWHPGYYDSYLHV